MRPELRATAQCLLPVCNVFNEKTVRLKIIKQHGGGNRLVFDHQDPWPIEIRCAATPHKNRADTTDGTEVKIFALRDRVLPEQPLSSPRNPVRISAFHPTRTMRRIIFLSRSGS